MNFVCKTCKGNFTIEYNIDNIVDYHTCPKCIVEHHTGCNKCNKCNLDKRLCDNCVEKSCCVKIEKIVKCVVLIPCIPIFIIPISYIVVRNKLLSRHWSEGLIY